LAEPDGGLLLGSAQGLARIDAAGRARPIAQGTPLERASILSLASEKPGRTWVGTYSLGLMLWDGQTVIQRIDRSNGLPSNEVRAIGPDGNGGLWIGTSLGLAHWQKSGVNYWTAENGLPSNFVISLDLDDRGRLWVGTGVGAVLLENGTMRALALSRPNDSEYAFDFLPDPAHKSVWVATDRGLLRFNEDGEATGAIGLQNNLPFEKVFGLLLDANEHLWLSGNRGMVRMPLAKAHAVADGRLANVDAELVEG
jgi:ligand-binding sensor domain-containing protein